MAGRELPPVRGAGNGSRQVGHYPVGYPGSPDPGARTTGYSGYQALDEYGRAPHGYDPGPAHAPGGGSRRFIDYPRRGKRGWRRWFPSWKLLTALAGIGFLLLILLFAVAYAVIDIPKTDQATLAQTTVIDYAGGKELGRLATQNRQSVEFAQIPVDVQHAVLAAEDRTFYTNNGISPTGIVRAAWSNARGNPTQGGSTITQQYVKNAFKMQKNRTVASKFREFFIALKINKSTKKGDLFKEYLNTIYFGRGAYGIQAASQAYFHRDVGDLNVSQAAYLAGVINSPSLADDPTGDKTDRARATFRWNVVLNAMVDQKWITADQRGRITKFPKVYPPSSTTSLKGQRGYLVTTARLEAAKDLNVDPDQIETGGYRIVTTFRKPLVDAGVKAVEQTMPSSTPKRVHIGMAAIDPDTGAILAIYGGKGFQHSQYNEAMAASAQGGSTFKAFTLLAALDKGVSLYSRYSSQSPLQVGGFKFENFGGEHWGNVDLLFATKHSINTVFAQLNKEVGKSRTRQAAEQAGLPKTVQMEDNLANVLGTASARPIDMARVYGTFAAQGTKHTPYSVSRIERISDGHTIWPLGDQLDKAGTPSGFSKKTMANLTYALQQPIKGGTGAYAQSLGRPAAGKTGTSSHNVSAWFVGYTPQISVAVMMYENGTGKHKRTQIPMKPFGGVSSITGGSFPVRIWTAFTKAALQGEPIEQFPQPDLGGGEIYGTPAPPAPTSTATQPSNPTPSNNPTPTQTQPPVTVFPTFGNGNGNNGNNNQ